MTISSWQIEFAQPLWFALLAALPLLLIFWRRSLVQCLAGPEDRFAVAAKPAVVARGRRPGRTEGDRAGQSADRRFPVAEERRRRLAAARRSRSSPRTTFAPASRFRSTCSCGPRRPARPPLNCSATAQPLLKKPAVAGRRREPRRAFPTSCCKPSQVVYSVRVKDEQGAWPDDNESACAVYVDPPPRVLLVESQPVLAEHLKKALAGENVEVEVQPELPAGRACRLRPDHPLQRACRGLARAADEGPANLRPRRSRRADRGRRRPLVHARRVSRHDAGRDPAGDLRRAEGQAQADPGDGPGAGHLRLHERPVGQREDPQHRPGQGGPANGRQHARPARPGGRAGLRRPQPLDLAAGARDRQSRRSSPRSTPSRPKAARTCIRRWSRPICRSARPLPT